MLNQRSRNIAALGVIPMYGYKSFIEVVMNSRDQYEIIGLCKISYFIKQPCRSVCWKKHSKLLKQCSTLAKQSGKSNILIYNKLLKFQASPKFRLPDCQPAVRPGSARCRPPDFSQVMYVQSHRIYKFPDPLKICQLHHLASF